VRDHVQVGDEHRDDSGRAWIAWIDDGYSASLQGGLADPTIYDPGIDGVTLVQALEWARARTDWIIVRPEWDPGVHYWAGVGPIPKFHELGQDVVPILREHEDSA
jgi:hypothetical protein